MVLYLKHDDMRGRQTFRVEPGTHTIVIDSTTVWKAAIAEFVKSQTGGQHSGRANGEDIALAIGRFDVPLDMFYDKEDVRDIQDLDDHMLADIVRHRMAREAEKKTEDDDADYEWGWKDSDDTHSRLGVITHSMGVPIESYESAKRIGDKNVFGTTIVLRRKTKNDEWEVVERA